MIAFTDIARGLQDLFSHAEGPLKAYKEIKEIRAIFTNKGSIIKLLKNFLVEPTIFVSKSVREQCPDKEHAAIDDMLDLFCSFYAQAFKVLTGYFDADAKVALELLGTSGYDYNLGDSIEALALKHAGLNSVLVSSDDVISKFKHKNFLSFDVGNLENPTSPLYTSGLLATKKDYANQFSKMSPTAQKNAYASTRVALDNMKEKQAFDGRQIDFEKQRAGQGISAAKDGGRLGRMHEQALYGYQIREFNISIVKGDPKNKVVVEVPITVKANLVFVRPEELVNALMPKHDDKSIFARWDKWRSGGIKFWKDLVLCSDIIREYKQNKLRDREDIMGKMSAAEIAGMTKAGLNGTVGYERFYNMYINTASDRVMLEKFLKGKLDSPKFKEDFLIKSNGLAIMCLDTEWEIAQVYIKDINSASNIKFDKLGKRKSKDGTINELFKALYSNQAPVF